MEIAQLIHSYIQTLIWPCIAVFVLVSYRNIITALVTQTKIKFTMGGVTIETTLTKLEQSVSESLRGHPLTIEQWDWLKRLRDKGRVAYIHESKTYESLRPLRNSGLIREHPEGWLSNASEVEITSLGKLLLEAYEGRSGKVEDAKQHTA